MSQASEMRELLEMVKSMNESVESYRNLLSNGFGDIHGFKFEVADELALFTKEQVESFSESILMKLFTKFRDPDTTKEIPEDFDARVAFVKNDLLAIYDETKDYRSMLDDRNKIIQQADAARKDYVAYLNSPEYAKKKAESQDALAKKMEEETDEKKKESYRKTLDTLISSEHMDFIFTRFNSLGEKEIRNIADNFFDARRSKYIRDKFAVKVAKQGFTTTDIQHLADIEACLLGEDYYAFNNLFLFIAMRFIAYSDPSQTDDNQFVASLILRLNKLVYHRFGSQEEEDAVLAVIRDVDDKFRGMEERFREKNQYDPRSEYAKKKKAEDDEKIRKFLRDWYAHHDMTYPEEITDVEALKKRARDDQKRSEIMQWLDTYEIEYDRDASLEDLEKIKEGIVRKTPEESEQKEKSDDESISGDEDQESETDRKPEKESDSVEEDSNDDNSTGTGLDSDVVLLSGVDEEELVLSRDRKSVV